MKKICKAGVAFAAVLALTGGAFAQETYNVIFDLHAHVYDYGEAVNQVIIKTADAGLKALPANVSPDTFAVYATAVNPYDTGSAPQYGTYTHVRRSVEKAAVDADGNIVLDLHCEYNGKGQGTLNYVAGDIGRNLSLNISYQVVQKGSFSSDNGTVAAGDASYDQGCIIDGEVSAFKPARYGNLNYELYTPSNADDGKKHPLIIWFHGNGEGGYNDVQNNTSQLRANRGALGFTEKASQDIFGGAYVAAPQVPDTWYFNYKNGYIKTAADMIKDIALRLNVDSKRIYVFGCSAGGYMTVHMAVNNPELFAAVVPTCPAISVAKQRGGVETTDSQIKKLAKMHVWLIQSKDDTTVLEKDCAGRIKTLLGDKVIYTPYDSVTADGVKYPGHWSWIYTARNMPSYNNTSVFNWTAAQKR